MINPQVLSPVPICTDQDLVTTIKILHALDRSYDSTKSAAVRERLMAVLGKVPESHRDERIDIEGRWLYIGGTVMHLRAKHIDRFYAGPKQYSPGSRE